MIGLRGLYWVGCWALLALACGRTETSDDNARGYGGRHTGGAGTGSGGATRGGSRPTAHAGTTGEAGEMGAAVAAAKCPVAPAAGQWVALGPDPYGLVLTSDGSHLSGEGCLGGLPSLNQGFVQCSPLSLLADTGRSVDIVWTMEEITLGYTVALQLTLSPERTELAGKVWTTFSGFDGEGEDIVFVRTGDEPVPAATACSGGEPSGKCFLTPLRSDRIDELRVVEVGGDLLLLWRNRRGLQARVASARFDAATRTWQAAEFLDDGSAPVDSTLLSVSPGGWAMLAYGQNNALLTRAYDPMTKVWSKQLSPIAAPRPSDLHRAKGLFVYDGGNATLVASTQPLDAVRSLAAYDYQASNKAWVNTHVFEGSQENAYEWGAASDSAGHELAVWVRGSEAGKPHELWFSARSRSAASEWATPALFFTSDKQIVRPALAVGQDGTALVTWQERTTRIGSSAYSFDTSTWSEPLTITTESQVDNHELRFDDAGAAVAYLGNSGNSFPNGELKSVLSDAGWSTPQVSSEQEASGATYQVMGKSPLQTTRIQPRAGEEPLPGLERPRCEGY